MNAIVVFVILVILVVVVAVLLRNVCISHIPQKLGGDYLSEKRTPPNGYIIDLYNSDQSVGNIVKYDLLTYIRTNPSEYLRIEKPSIALKTKFLEGLNVSQLQGHVAARPADIVDTYNIYGDLMTPELKTTLLSWIQANPGEYYRIHTPSDALKTAVFQSDKHNERERVFAEADKITAALRGRQTPIPPPRKENTGIRSWFRN
jgi:hypothetical protein